MTLSQNKSLIHFLCQWLPILIQIMNLLWISDLLLLLYLSMINPQGDGLGDGLGDRQGGSQGGEVMAMHKYNPASHLHLTVPVFHTTMHGLHIGCQHMGDLFAPSVMLNTGEKRSSRFQP